MCMYVYVCVCCVCCVLYVVLCVCCVVCCALCVVCVVRMRVLCVLCACVRARVEQEGRTRDERQETDGSRVRSCQAEHE